MATTVWPWMLRHFGRHAWGEQRMSRLGTAVIVVELVLVAAAVAALVAKGTPAAPGPGQASGQRGASARAAGVTSLTAVAAVRRQAAAWVSEQVGGDSIVACDPAMCGTLQAAGVAPARLLMMGPGQGDPLGSDVVVATAVVRDQFGTRMAGVYAPVILAEFGSGDGRIDIRAVAPQGAAAYLASITADMSARRVAGAQLASNPSIQLAAAARRQLDAGLVDSRLLATLATLATLHPLEIFGFGDLPHGASSGVPLRWAVVGPAPGPDGGTGATLRSLTDFLLAQQAPYRPAQIAAVQAAPHRTAIRVEYAAPSPLGLLTSRS